MKQWGGYTLLPGQSVLLITDGKTQTDIELEIKSQIQERGQLTIIEHSNRDSVLSVVNPATIDGAISFAREVALHNDSFLLQLVTLLKPGGFLVLYEPLHGRTVNRSEELSLRLTLSGFIDTKIVLAGEFVEISSTKPGWEVGASQKLNPSTKGPTTSITQNDMNNIWSATTTEDQELIDEDSLLNESDKAVKPSTKSDDCEVGKKGRKACKNCTCGRAEQTDDVPRKRLTLEMIENPGVNSSCGSCALGDAFRCAGCPYRGLPAFKVGEKITLPSSFLDDDV
jgi:hypothetical protein